MQLEKIREQIEDDILYLLKNKVIKLKEVPDYVHHLFLKRSGFDMEHFSFADKCYEEMIVDSIRAKNKRKKPEHERVIKDFLDYRKQKECQQNK